MISPIWKIIFSLIILSATVTHSIPLNPNAVSHNKRSVQYSVNIISSPEQFQIGASFSMRCQVTPQLRDVKYSWFKDGRLVSNEETLRFDKLTKEDLGSYRCVVSGKTESGAAIELEATAFQKMSEFDIQRFENQHRINNEKIDSKSVPYSVNIISSGERFQLGEQFWMRCQVTPQLREVRYSWFKDGRLVGNEETLRFTSLKKEDLGSYRCVVTGKTENGMTIEIEATAFMKVSELESRRTEYREQQNNRINNGGINSRSVEYSVNIVSSADRFQVGQPFAFRCQVAPQLRDVRYSWYKDGRLVGNGETLRFNSLRKEDFGSYRCVVTGKAENGMTIEMEASAFMTFSEFETQRFGNHLGPNKIVNKKSTSEYVEYSVNIISTPEQIELGTPFSMRCLVEPQMQNTEYSWYKDDRLISKEETVQFRSLKKDDLGSYKCVVSGTTETGDTMELEATAYQKFYD